MPVSDELNSFYSNYLDIRANPEVVRLNAGRNIDFIERDFHLRKDSWILDFGRGANLFVEQCRDRGYSRSFGYDRYVMLSGSADILSWDECLKQKWELITLWGVLEHLTNPEATLKTLASIATPDARLVITTVCTETAIPYRHKPPEHTLYFSKQSLECLGDLTGWRLAGCRDYMMMQDSDIYLSILLRTMPAPYRERVSHSLDRFIEVPTNEVMAFYTIK